uniref:Uncharacterized protein n=1 Tax=Arundo donax TaxID=35708 RepID=A0A0A9D243_ARUDO
MSLFLQKLGAFVCYQSENIQSNAGDLKAQLRCFPCILGPTIIFLQFAKKKLPSFSSKVKRCTIIRAVKLS